MKIKIPAIPESDARFIRHDLLAWGKINFANFPWRFDHSHFHALVAEVLLQRTRAEQVIPVYLAFKNRFPDCYALAVASIEEIEEIILPLGLRWRAKYLSSLGSHLVDLNGHIPSDVALIETLPSVGPYAASAFLSLHMNKRIAIVDSNIVRFYGRFFGFDYGPETRRDKNLLKFADKMIPVRSYRLFNYALIDFTRSVCRPRPVHELCPLVRRCATYTG